MSTRPVSITHLVLGLVLLGIAGSWALRESGVIDPDGMRWVLPVVLLVAGGAGLAASLGRAVTRSGAEEPVQGTHLDA